MKTEQVGGLRELQPSKNYSDTKIITAENVVDEANNAHATHTSDKADIRTPIKLINATIRLPLLTLPVLLSK